MITLAGLMDLKFKMALSRRIQIYGIASFIFIIITIVTFHKRSGISTSTFQEVYQGFSASHGSEKLAYSTFLVSTPPPEGNAPENDDDDPYFVAARILAYQILHAPQTRSNRSIPLVILTAPDVSESKRNRLIKDGAKVVPTQYITTGADWMQAGIGNWKWKDVMTKMRLWELEEYSRILFLDTDTILQHSLDGIFDEECSQKRDTRTNITNAVDEAMLPSSYVMAGISEPRRGHKYPPTLQDFHDPDLLNAGFFLFSPSKEMFKYYMSVLSIKDRFDPTYPEQNLMNYAHRLEGAMPWQRMPSTWNIRGPTDEDLTGGVVSIHQKWWAGRISPQSEKWILSIRWRMQGFYEGRDALEGK